MNRMKKHNFGRILWVTSLFLLLIEILFMVMDYKINYQYLTKNELYFYECEGNLCVSEVQEKKNLVYSKYDCGEKECPFYKKSIDNNYVVLEYRGSNKTLLFNYRTGKMISNSYEDYTVIDEEHLIVTDNAKQGIIDNVGKIIVPIIYDQIGIVNNQLLEGYNFQSIIVKKDNLYGILSYKKGTIIEKVEYQEKDLALLLDKLKEEPNRNN